MFGSKTQPPVQPDDQEPDGDEGDEGEGHIQVSIVMPGSGGDMPGGMGKGPAGMSPEILHHVMALIEALRGGEGKMGQGDMGGDDQSGMAAE